MMKKLFVLVVILFLGACSVNMGDNFFRNNFEQTLFLYEGATVTLDTHGGRFDLEIINEAGERHPMSGSGMAGRFNAVVSTSGEYTITINGRGRFELILE